MFSDENAFRPSAFLDTRGDDSERVEALRDAVMGQFPADAEEGPFTAVAREASPFSALAYALGPHAVLRLPGWFGDFLCAAERIHTWMTGLGDDPDHDADELDARAPVDVRQVLWSAALLRVPTVRRAVPRSLSPKTKCQAIRPRSNKNGSRVLPVLRSRTC